MDPDGELAGLVEEITQKLEAGDRIDLADYAQAPDDLKRLRKVLPALEVLVLAGQANHQATSPNAASDHDEPLSGRQLGDYRIVRELGRGGMGVVYEAEQLSMGRRVALKVLPFAALVQDKTLHRFRNEVRAAAALDHDHIVPIYSVGEERGVHYYAMQLVRGQSLAQAVEELRKQRDVGYSMLDVGSKHSTNIQHPASNIQDRASSSDTHTIAALSTVAPYSSSEYYRTIARLGIQAAEALQHAHDQGVLHRDIKPSNLLLDRDGKLYVADFGLARIEADAGMTMTGDLVGTLRYMAPEQALAKRVVIDHRADVYSLGATLYELLALEPAFHETDRAELLKQIAFEEPRPLRKVDRRIPAELETIVLKAMAKSREDRYQTAQQLASDLAAFLENRPIIARPPSAADRLQKWGRRNRALVALFFAAVTLIAIVATVSGSLLAVAYRGEQMQRHLAEERLSSSRRSAYNLQLAHVRDIWQRDSVLAYQRLEDPELCPPEFRDFTWRFYRRLCRPDRFTLNRDDTPKTSAVYSAKHGLVVSGDVDGVLGVWNADTGVNIARHGDHTDIITDLEIAPNEELLASASRDSSVRLWTIDRANAASPVKEKCVVLGRGGPVMDVAFSPDGSTLAGGDTDKAIHLWDVETGKEIGVYGTGRRMGQRILALTFSPSGTYFAAASESSHVWIWRAKDSEPVARVGGEDLTSSLPLAFAPDESILAVGGRSITLWNWANKERIGTLPGHSGHEVSGIDFSADGKQLISAGFDGKLRFWDVAALKQQFYLSGHSDRVSSLYYSRSTGSATTASYDGTVKFWNLNKNLEERTLQVAGGAANTVAFRPQSHQFVSANVGDIAELWNAEDGQQLGQFVGHQDDVECAGFSPDGLLLATAGRDRTVRLWDPQTFQELAKLDGHTDRVNVLAFSPDGRLLASGGLDRSIRIWDVQSRQFLRELAGHTDRVWALGFSPDGRQLVATSRDGTIRFWDPATGYKLELLREPSGAGVGCCAFSPDGHTLATGTSRISQQGDVSGIVRLWEMPSRKIRRVLHGHTDEVFSVIFSPDGRTLASSSRDGVIRLWDPVTGQERANLPGHKSWVYNVDFSSDGEYMASAGQDGEIKLWSGVAMEEPPTSNVAAQNLRQDESFKTLELHTEKVQDLAIHAGRNLLASIGWGRVIGIWDIPTGACLRTFRSEGSRFNSVDWSRDGSSVLTADTKGKLKWWSADSGQMLQQTIAASKPIYAAMSHDGQLIAVSEPNHRKPRAGAIAVYEVGANEPKFRIRSGTGNWPLFSADDKSVITADLIHLRNSMVMWRSAVDGKELAEFSSRYYGRIFSFCFSPDEKALVVAGNDPDRLIEIWDMASQRRLHTLRGHKDEVHRVAVSPDGRFVASGSNDQTVRLWELSTGRLFKVFRGHTGAITALEFTPDSNILISGSGDHTIKFWNVADVIQTADVQR
jgi:WD40 repeat protein/serine/threonine protein kinase